MRDTDGQRDRQNVGHRRRKESGRDGVFFPCFACRRALFCSAGGFGFSCFCRSSLACTNCIHVLETTAGVTTTAFGIARAACAPKYAHDARGARRTQQSPLLLCCAVVAGSAVVRPLLYKARWKRHKLERTLTRARLARHRHGGGLASSCRANRSARASPCDTTNQSHREKKKKKRAAGPWKRRPTASTASWSSWRRTRRGWRRRPPPRGPRPRRPLRASRGACSSSRRRTSASPRSTRPRKGTVGGREKTQRGARKGKGKRYILRAFFKIFFFARASERGFDANVALEEGVGCAVCPGGGLRAPSPSFLLFSLPISRNMHAWCFVFPQRRRNQGDENTTLVPGQFLPPVFGFQCSVWSSEACKTKEGGGEINETCRKS